MEKKKKPCRNACCDSDTVESSGILKRNTKPLLFCDQDSNLHLNYSKTLIFLPNPLFDFIDAIGEDALDPIQ